MVTVLGPDTLCFRWDRPDLVNGLPEEYILTCDPIFPVDLLEGDFSKTYALVDANRTASVMDEVSVFSPGVVYRCTVVSKNTAGVGEPAAQTVTTDPEGKTCGSINCNMVMM